MKSHNDFYSGVRELGITGSSAFFRGDAVFQASFCATASVAFFQGAVAFLASFAEYCGLIFECYEPKPPNRRNV